MNAAHSDAWAEADILIVDDAANSLHLLEDLLTGAGYHVRPANDGRLALHSVQAKLPDLILLDIRMPGLDGYQVCRELKSNARTRSIPVIFISASENEADKIKGFQAGGVDFINKPFRSDEVLARVRTHLALYQTQAALEQANVQLAAANQELEAFAYSVSHDLRAPLRHINGFMALLQERTAAQLDPQSQHYMRIVAESARQMDRLVEDLLSFSRMTRNEISKTRVDLEALVQGVIAEFQSETKDRDIHWQIDPLPQVTGDQAMLRVVLVNLISNALKFTRPRAQARIEIGCATISGHAHQTVIYIRDNGVGFDMQYADKLFGVFQRLHSADAFEGTGIGLANVRRIINRHGGETWAESEMDHGATFYFSLPIL